MRRTQHETSAAAVQVRAFKPDGEDSYDMTAYQDADGSAYIVRSVGNVFLGISALTSDYLDTTGICSAGPRARPRRRPGQKRPRAQHAHARP